jgi:FkbM family methyltransferase
MVSIRLRTRSLIGTAVDRAVATVSPHVGPGSALRPMLRSLRHRLPTPVEPLTHLVAEFARMYPDAFFVQVGANDGSKGDYLKTYVDSLGWTGVLIEPIPYVFARLSDRHGTNPNLTLVNAAIAHEDGTAELYYLPKDEHSDLPVWYDALATFRKEVILKHAPWIPDIEARITTIEVPTVTFESMCQVRGVEGIDLLQIDTEGYDYEVIRQVDLDKHRPALILFEHYHLTSDDRRACEDLLDSRGYRTISNFMDTIAIRIDDADRRNRRLAKTLSGLQDGSR